MANNYFNFKQFTIRQEKSAMKVGTDGVLLGAWANCSNAKSILDIGSGTGLIALMLAQRSSASIHGIEIDEAAFTEACYNTKQSPWSEKVTMHHTSLQEYATTSQNKYDLIVSNPPFFENSLKADVEARTTARHSDSLSTAELFAGVTSLLNENGKFAVVIPADNMDLYKKAAKQSNLFCISILHIKPTPQKPPKRVLMEFRKKYCKLAEETLIVEEFGRHQYSDKYKQITREFYLAF